jgi:hypothetical protein
MVLSKPVLPTGKTAFADAGALVCPIRAKGEAAIAALRKERRSIVIVILQGLNLDLRDCTLSRRCGRSGGTPASRYPATNTQS